MLPSFDIHFFSYTLQSKNSLCIRPVAGSIWGTAAFRLKAYNEWASCCRRSVRLTPLLQPLSSCRKYRLVPELHYLPGGHRDHASRSQYMLW
jgi:hypothetical protein